jgi:hypothetical protein
VSFAWTQPASFSLRSWPLLFAFLSPAFAQSQGLIEPSSRFEPASPPENPSTQPSSLYAAPAPAATSALVHDQEAAFWPAQPVAGLVAQPFQWGPLQARPFATYRFTYGNGLNAQPSQKEATALHQISPGLLLNSKYLTLNYSPTLSYYSSQAFDDTVDHSVSGSLHGAFGDWSFVLSHGFSKTAQPLIETGAQTPQQNQSSTLSAHYQATEKTSFDFSLSQKKQEAEALTSSTTWSSMNWGNYQFSDKTLVGIGVGAGYDDVDQGSDMRFQQFQGRIGWRPGTKLNIEVNGGVEIRDFVSGLSESRINPLFGGTVSYTLWEATTLLLSANRAVAISLFENQLTENAQVSAGFRQRFLGKLNLSAFVSFSTVDYQDTSGVQTQADRSDEVGAFSTSLGLAVLKKGDLSVFYQHSRNRSTVKEFSFDSDQVGFQIGYRF